MKHKPLPKKKDTTDLQRRLEEANEAWVKAQAARPCDTREYGRNRNMAFRKAWNAYQSLILARGVR